MNPFGLRKTRPFHDFSSRQDGGEQQEKGASLPGVLAETQTARKTGHYIKKAQKNQGTMVRAPMTEKEKAAGIPGEDHWDAQGAKSQQYKKTGEVVS